MVLLSAFLPLGRHPEVEAGQPWSSPRLPRLRLSIVQMAVEVQDPTKKNVKSMYCTSSKLLLLHLSAVRLGPLDLIFNHN